MDISKNSLKTAGRQQVPAETYIEAWQALLERLSTHSNAGIPLDILEALAAQTGLPPTNLRAGLRIGFEGLSRPIAPFAAEPPDRAKPLKIAILAAGNVPCVALAPAILLASAGCRVIVKQSRHEQVAMPWLLGEFHKTYSNLPDLIEAISLEKSSQALHALLSEADRILAFGATSTIEHLQQRYPHKVTGFGHKISFAYFDQPDSDSKKLARLAQDIVLFNQQGCLSPQAVFVKASAAEIAGWAKELSGVLAEKIAALGGSCLTSAAKIRRNAQVEALLLRDVPFFRSENHAVCALMPRFSADEVTGNCFVQIVAVADEKHALEQLEPIRRYWQGMAVAAVQKDFSRLKRLYEKAGFSYVCAPGSMQAPPLDWPNGGIRLPMDVL